MVMNQIAWSQNSHYATYLFLHFPRTKPAAFPNKFFEGALDQLHIIQSLVSVARNAPSAFREYSPYGYLGPLGTSRNLVQSYDRTRVLIFTIT